MTWQTSLIFLIGGLIGGALKAWASNSQDTWSRKSLADVFVSGLVGLLWPSLGPIPLPAGANIVQQAAFIALVSYAASHLVTNVVEKLGGGGGIPGKLMLVVAGLALTLGGCTTGNFFCKGKGSMTVTAMLYNATATGDCGDGFMYSEGKKSLPLPPSLAPATAPSPVKP